MYYYSSIYLSLSLMEFIQADLDNINEIKNIIGLIHEVFSKYNKEHSTENLIRRMDLLYGPKYDYQHTLSHFNTSTLFFIAKEQNTIIGMIRWNHEKISNLYVLKKWQRKWIGQKLLQTFEHAAKEIWSTHIRIKSSKFALPFYLKNGYTIDHNNRLIKYF